MLGEKVRKLEDQCFKCTCKMNIELDFIESKAKEEDAKCLEVQRILKGMSGRHADMVSFGNQTFAAVPSRLSNHGIFGWDGVFLTLSKNRGKTKKCLFLDFGHPHHATRVHRLLLNGQTRAEAKKKRRAF